MKSDLPLDEIKEMRFIEGQVTAVYGRTNTVDVNFSPEFGSVSGIDIAYCCQGGGGDGSGGYTAFAIDDTVVAEWCGVGETVPAADDLRVIGFSDGIPRCCDLRIMSMNYANYVAFYDCSNGCCYVPPAWDASMVVNSWSGDGWIYFLCNPARLTEFIESILGGPQSYTNINGIEYINPSVTQTLTTINSLSLNDTWTEGTTYAPACNGNEMRSGTYTGTAFNGIRSSAYYDIAMYMKIYNKSGTITHDGQDLLPAGWRIGSDFIYIADEFYRSMSYTWEYGETGSAFSIKCHCTICPLPEIDVDYYTYLPIGLGYNCGPGMYQAGNRTSQYNGLSRGWFLTRDFSVGWKVDQLPYMGSGVTQISIPSWPGLPPVNPNQTVLDTATVTRCIQARCIAKTNGTVGYIYGERKGVDWNWGLESNFSFAGYTDWIFQLTTTHIVAPAVAPTGDNSPNGWDWSEPQYRRTYLAMSGLGYQTKRTFYLDIETDIEEEFNQDRADRRVAGYQDTYEQRSCWSMIGWNRYCDPTGDDVETHLTYDEELHKYNLEGKELSINGKKTNDMILVPQLWSEHPGGWQDDGIPASPPTYLLNMISAARCPEDDPGDEWAEGLVRKDSAGWILAFFQAMCAEAPPPYDELNQFVGTLCSNNLKFRYKT